MISSFLSKVSILVFGTLYPAYSSYKAIKRKDVREYTRLMMYWVCFGIFSATEFATDILFSFWFPFYYEAKILFILWLNGNGAKIFYKSIVHPELDKREEIIDSYINEATLFGLNSFKQAWRKFSSYLNTALVYGAHSAYSALIHRAQSSDVTDSAFPNTFLASILPRRPEPTLRLFDDQTLSSNQARITDTYQQQPSHSSLSSPLSSTPESFIIEEVELSEEENDEDDFPNLPSTNQSSLRDSTETLPVTHRMNYELLSDGLSSHDEDSNYSSAFDIRNSVEPEDRAKKMGKQQRKRKTLTSNISTSTVSSEVSSRPRRAAATRARDRFKDITD